MRLAAFPTALRAKVRAIHVPVLADTFSSRANSVGFLRLLFASGVLVSHGVGIGFGKETGVPAFTRYQWDLGGISVYGFFMLSGFLITASGLKFGVGRYFWHRFLRIFPGLWGCLLVTALVLAPVVALIEYGTTAGLWSAPDGPFAYLWANWFGGVRQYNISNLFVHTPLARVGGGNAMDGSLWTLLYELTCYVGVAALAVTGVLRRAPRMVLLITAVTFAIMLNGYLHQSSPYAGIGGYRNLGPYPLIGSLGVTYLLLNGFMFLLGSTAYLYRHRVPMHPALAGLAALVLLVTTRWGGFYVAGMSAFAYLTMWAACVLPRWLQGVGRARDYSYGVYVYAWPVSELLALLRVGRFGAVVYIGAVFLGTLALAIPSWHLIERPAMSLKSWSPRRPRPKTAAAPVGEIAPTEEPRQPTPDPKPLSPTAASSAVVGAAGD
jgi:peptidoglycan/LPS O-acetylase OafA/YrhL